MTDTDRDLLERAARAAGYDCRFSPDDPFKLYSMFIGPSWIAWNPLDDDGDALRLAVKLGLQVTPGTYNCEEVNAYFTASAQATERVHFTQDRYAATRRAIVRAAAALGDAK